MHEGVERLVVAHSAQTEAGITSTTEALSKGTGALQGMGCEPLSL